MNDKYKDLRDALANFNKYPWSDETRNKIIRAAPALLAERDALRDALLWNAAALQACCAEGIREASNITIDSETKCFAEILDMADAALAQEQGGSDDNQTR